MRTLMTIFSRSKRHPKVDTKEVPNAFAWYAALVAGGLGALVTVGVRPATSASATSTASGYRVLLSRNDQLCTSLGNFYNQHLNDSDNASGYLEDQFGQELLSKGISFISEKTDWGSSGETAWIQKLPPIDIYNDGTSRTVILLDRSANGNFAGFATEFLILKPSAALTNEAEFLGKDFRGDPRLEQWIDFSKGGPLSGFRDLPTIELLNCRRLRTKLFWECPFTDRLVTPLSARFASGSASISLLELASMDLRSPPTTTAPP